MAGTVYDVITDRIIKSLEEGKAPWRQPWAGGGAPCNLISKKAYRGINIWLLSASGFKSRYWLTYKQAVSKGGNVKRGEKSTPCVFWRLLEGKEKANGEKGHVALLRYYSLFNLSQTEGIPDPTPEEDRLPFQPIEACERLIGRYTRGPRIEHGGGRACYSPAQDLIQLPAREDFSSPEEYYCTLFHEEAHATGAKGRLDREGITNPTKFGSHSYSLEELIAEMTSTYLCNEVGILNQVYDNSVAYMRNWAAKLKQETKWLVQAGGSASKAANYILDKDATIEEDEGT